MTLRVYNTLTRQKEDFKTVQPGRVGMYVCGPTVYKPSHVGHMVGPVIFDTVKRFLTYLGYDVTWVVNITDVDDKLIVRARELGTTVKELAEKMTADYVACLKKLGVTGIDHMPRATEHIPGMIEIMKGLIDKGYAYPAAGDVYFDVSRDADYGKLCNRDPEQLEAGARIEISERKRNPGDFALWKGAKPGEPSWESPWGPGRPGWHIECSAMSMKLLGKTLDIHGGGLDLQFPHHENELAQSESYTDQPFARYWMHNGLMKMGQSKMAGSVGNVVNVVDLLQKHSAETVRFLLLNTHYRSPIDYSEERLAETQRSLDSFHRFFERYQRITNESFYEIQAPTGAAPIAAQNRSDAFLGILGRRERFLECMHDDFNTGGAIGVMFELLNALNRFAKEVESKSADVQEFREGVVVLKELSQILGLFVAAPTKQGGFVPPGSITMSIPVQQPSQFHAQASTLPQGSNPALLAEDEFLQNLVRLATEVGGGSSVAALEPTVPNLLQLLIALRADARKTKNFAVADQIRKRLTELKVTLEDRPGGTGWRVG